MKRIYYYIIGAVALLGVTVGATWIGAVNGEIRKNEAVGEKMGNVHSSLSARYTKMDVLIDAIQSADSTLQGYLTLITEARVAFAEAMTSGNSAVATEQAEIIDSTFVSLVAWMEAYPDDYSTVGLYAGFMAEFSASTNAVVNEIGVYNSAVRDYNTHIQVFPNFIFLKGKTTYTQWVVTNYNIELPTFS